MDMKRMFWSALLGVIDPWTGAVCWFGGKGASSSPPPPDPAVGQAAAANAEVAKEALDFNKQVYEEGKPRQERLDELSKTVVDNAMDAQKEQTALSKKYTDYLQKTYWPIEQSLANDATNFDTEAKREELAGRAGADASQAIGLSDASARRDAARFGVNPGDAAFSEGLAGSSLNRAALTTDAANKARTAARTEGRAYKFDVAGLGRNLPGAGASTAQLGLSANQQALGAGAIPASNARADAGLMNQGFTSAVGANSASGNLALGQYNSQLGAYSNAQRAQAQEDAGMGQMLGMLGGAAIAAFSDENMKTDIQSIDEDAVLGDKDDRVLKGVRKIPVKSWRYKGGLDDGEVRLGPMAQDVHRQFGEEAAPGGVKLDLITMNGINLAGLRALDKKVSRIEHKLGLS